MIISFIPYQIPIRVQWNILDGSSTRASDAQNQNPVTGLEVLASGPHSTTMPEPVDPVLIG